ncbi:hypothetical protein Y032_0009g792 [Ancylostoma ceylanicum]|uniref:Uncharacterized protein n=1 Tax=Ancylostoma ceylanicum TaxID=53326 RepID=A0A016VJI8_9BILA|nr:hypothetical protein Y032_0009g792 [Ancylostoma ceylanicum]
MIGDKKKSATGKLGMSTLAPKSKLHFEGFKGLEPLRDGDDVNLNSEECEDLKGKDALEQPGKDKGKPPPVGGAGAQPSKPPTSKETTTGSKSKSDASGKKRICYKGFENLLSNKNIRGYANPLVSLQAIFIRSIST